MPNHCYQSVYLHGPRDIVRELYFNLNCKEPRFCDVVIPMPLLEAGNSYNWCCDNWGTKWDVAEAEITEPLAHEDVFDKSWFSFRCWTAWGAPIPVWDKLHAMGVEVQAEYQDEGGMFEGEYHHGEDRSWDPEIKEEA